VARLFKRDWRVLLGTLDAGKIDLRFKAKRTTGAEPNKLELSVFNLTEAQRNDLARQRGSAGGAKRNPLPIELYAGYAEETFLIFKGQAHLVENHRDGSDWITEIQALDGGVAYKTARINKSFAKGVSVKDVLKAAVGAMGIGQGNLAKFASAQLQGGGSTYAAGTVLSGAASQELDGVVRSLGLRWSTQNGALQLQERGKPLDKAAVRLAPDSGLVGSPAALAVDNKKTRGLSKARALLIAGLEPGRKVVVDSASLQGSYEIIETEYTGDTIGTDWHADLRLRVYEG
jgi:hypothetical protein